jgi:hypothetical protein
MKTLKPIAVALFVALALTGAGKPAAAADPPMPTPPLTGSDAEALARAAIEQLVRALGLALQAVPQYEMPRMNENGDIIIRRANPRPIDVRPPSPDEAAT